MGEGTFTAIELFRRLHRETDDMHIRLLIEKYLPAFERIEKLQQKLQIPFTVTDKKRYVDGILRGRTFPTSRNGPYLPRTVLRAPANFRT